MTCYKKHGKKTEISDVVAAIVKNRHFFVVFSENYENSQAKNPVDGKKKSQKLNLFNHFLEIWENRIFHWEWANRREKLMKAPYRICSCPYKPEITIFGAVKRRKTPIFRTENS